MGHDTQGFHGALVTPYVLFLSGPDFAGVVEVSRLSITHLACQLLYFSVFGGTVLVALMSMPLPSLL